MSKCNGQDKTTESEGNKIRNFPIHSEEIHPVFFHNYSAKENRSEGCFAEGAKDTKNE
jgi:hypothetical protein